MNQIVINLIVETISKIGIKIKYSFMVYLETMTEMFIFDKTTREDESKTFSTQN
jgi:hypothetical protein